MRKWLATVLIAAVAFAVRFYNLGNPPLFFDESIHATILKSLISGTYKYNPAYHGPLLYYILYLPVTTLGESEFSLRLVPAAVGVAVSLTPLLYRRFIGFNAAAISSAFVAISPIIVNYSRFARADIFQLFLTALFTYFIFRYLEVEKTILEKKFDRDSLFLIASFICMAFFATLKETFYPFAALFLIFLIFDIKKFRLTDLLVSILVFFVIYSALYTNFFTYTTPLTNFSEFPAVRAVSYWKYQHEIARIAGPWYYYLELLILYDFPAFALGIFTIILTLKRRDRSEFEAFIVYWFVASLIFFSYMQEKVPWLAVHILFPMYVLAGVGICKINSRSMKALALISCLLFLGYGMLAVNILNPVNPAEPALYLPTQYDVREFAEKTRNDTIYVFTNIGEYWPLAWYLKDHHVYFSTSSVKGRSFSKGVYVVVNQTNDIYIPGNMKKIDTMVVRCWTFWTHPELSRIPEFLLFRRPLTKVYCMNFTVYTRVD
ncbi:flippase activity-associated protein Agl23 [Archaeoglobus neptunius]|uniref:flippase activity-associated protein Agl23 n=1 Tax=Archaeoglobus neptunius TaxID=2798580 RepID=UPI00192689BD|nr:flippase activity-associated protein Agl23 [Archaeoglobus neptunius]